MAGFSTRRFLTDADYRETEALPALGRSLRYAWDGMAQEGKESFQALGHLLEAADGGTLTDDEKGRLKTQLQDLVKAVPMLAVFLLPGGMIFLPLLLKVLPFDMRLSAFRDRDDSEARARETQSD